MIYDVEPKFVPAAQRNPEALTVVLYSVNDAPLFTEVMNRNAAVPFVLPAMIPVVPSHHAISESY
jgi:hypothetical protein